MSYKFNPYIYTINSSMNQIILIELNLNYFQFWFNEIKLNSNRSIFIQI